MTEKLSAGISPPEVLVLLSGGIDSACCLDFYQQLERPVIAMHVSYGQPAQSEEVLSAERIANYYRVPLLVASWQTERKKTIGEVAGRNAFLIAAAVLEAEPSVRTIALGIHSGTSYIDCSKNFFDTATRLIQMYAPPLRSLGTPFIEWHKGDLFAYAATRKVPIELTYSCELGGPEPCGKCTSCEDIQVVTAHAS